MCLEIYMRLVFADDAFADLKVTLQFVQNISSFDHTSTYIDWYRIGLTEIRNQLQKSCKM